MEGAVTGEGTEEEVEEDGGHGPGYWSPVWEAPSQ